MQPVPSRIARPGRIIVYNPCTREGSVEVDGRPITFIDKQFRGFEWPKAHDIVDVIFGNNGKKLVGVRGRPK